LTFPTAVERVVAVAAGLVHDADYDYRLVAALMAALSVLVVAMSAVAATS